MTRPRRSALAIGGGSGSKLAMSHLEMGRVGKRPAAALQPVGDPRDHLPGTDARIAEQTKRPLSIAEERIAALDALYNQRTPEAACEFLGNAANAQQFRPRKVEDERRRGDVG